MNRFDLCVLKLWGQSRDEQIGFYLGCGLMVLLICIPAHYGEMVDLVVQLNGKGGNMFDKSKQLESSKSWNG
jgi:hypothetical protein